MSAKVTYREAEDGAMVLAITGELDARSSAALLEDILPRIAVERTSRLDLSEVSFISSAGLRALLLAYRHAQRRGAAITLTGVQDEVAFVMEATGFLDLFDVEDRPAGHADGGRT
jgi:anti-sigma B factor antagonist